MMSSFLQITPEFLPSSVKPELGEKSNMSIINEIKDQSKAVEMLPWKQIRGGTSTALQAVLEVRNNAEAKLE